MREEAPCSFEKTSLSVSYVYYFRLLDRYDFLLYLIVFYSISWLCLLIGRSSAWPQMANILALSELILLGKLQPSLTGLCTKTSLKDEKFQRKFSQDLGCILAQTISKLKNNQLSTMLTLLTYKMIYTCTCIHTYKIKYSDNRYIYIRSIWTRVNSADLTWAHPKPKFYLQSLNKLSQPKLKWSLAKYLLGFTLSQPIDCPDHDIAIDFNVLVFSYW